MIREVEFSMMDYTTDFFLYKIEFRPMIPKRPLKSIQKAETLLHGLKYSSQ